MEESLPTFLGGMMAVVLLEVEEVKSIDRLAKGRKLIGSPIELNISE